MSEIIEEMALLEEAYELINNYMWSANLRPVALVEASAILEKIISDKINK